MSQIAIVGANGQVGSEVCLYLAQQPHITPVPVCRTQEGAAFLRRCGLEPRVGSVTDPELARGLLAGCGVVVDLALPSGAAHEARRSMGEIVEAISAHAEPDAALVYGSSITAFGFPDFEAPLRWYRLARNRYGALKRRGERLARRRARQGSRRLFVLRLGVVHGELQAVTRSWTRRIRANPDLVAFVPGCEAFTVFAFDIAQALGAIARGREDPGTYTLVSSPAWRWTELHAYLCARAGVEPRCVELDPATDARAQGAAGGILAGSLRGLASQHRELLDAYVLSLLPSTAESVRARYHRARAGAELAAAARAHQFRPYGSNHSILPGRRMQTLADSRAAMQPAASQLRRQLASLTGPSRSAASSGSA